MQQQPMAKERHQRLRVRLAQIQLALGRVRTQTYDECARCEEPIAYTRLKARPETPFCLRRCQGG